MSNTMNPCACVVMLNLRRLLTRMCVQSAERTMEHIKLMSLPLWSTDEQSLMDQGHTETRRDQTVPLVPGSGAGVDGAEAGAPPDTSDDSSGVVDSKLAQRVNDRSAESHTHTRARSAGGPTGPPNEFVL